VTDPIALAVGVAVTTYVRAPCVVGVFVELVDPPHATNEDPASTIATQKRIRLAARFRRNMNGNPIKAAQNSVPPLPQGLPGVWFCACILVLIVTVEVPLPPAVKVTALAVAVTFAGVPSVEATLVVNETVPA